MEVRTGDILLFSSNNPTGFLLRTFISSPWNHVGIAVRYREENNQCVVVQEGGKLCVLETNACERFDPIQKKIVQGVGYSSMKHLQKKYNRIDARHFSQNVLPADLPERIVGFVQQVQGHRFPRNFAPFLSVWLGIELGHREENSMFCSELVAQFLVQCLNIQDLRKAFETTKVPLTAPMYTPAHYDVSIIPSGKFLHGQSTIYVCEADLLYVILQPLLLLLIAIVFLSMLFFFRS